MWDQYCNASEKEEEGRKMASTCSEGKSRKEEPCRKNPSNDCPSPPAGDPSGIAAMREIIWLLYICPN